MTRYRRPIALLAAVALLTLAVSSTVAAAPGKSWDTRWIGTSGDDIKVGTELRDRLFGRAGADEIDALGGNDLVRGGKGEDEIDGGDGRDRLFGGQHDDEIDGGDGNDRIFGARGEDELTGGPGNDRIFGGRHGDKIYAVDGERDRIQCGQGYDYVWADKDAQGDPIDWVNEYNCEEIVWQYVP